MGCGWGSIWVDLSLEIFKFDASIFCLLRNSENPSFLSPLLFVSFVSKCVNEVLSGLAELGYGSWVMGHPFDPLGH